MFRRDFIRTTMGAGLAAGLNSAWATASSVAGPAANVKPKYRAGVIGLGWTGLLYDLGRRSGERFDIDDANRPTPLVEIQRRLHAHQHPGDEGLPQSYAEALWQRPEVELVAGADRDRKRLDIFSQRYGIKAVYTDGVEMMQKEKLDVVAICTNTKGRAFLTVKAAELGAKAIVTEKPMCHTLAEADAMVKACADRGIPLCCGAITTTHPSFARAKALVNSGAIGKTISIEAGGPNSQHQNWSYFLDSPAAWVVGTGDSVGNREFGGEGVLAAQSGLTVHFRNGAPGVRVTGTKGEIVFERQTLATHGAAWRWWQDIDFVSQLSNDWEPEKGTRRVEMPWPMPQFLYPYAAVYAVDDVLACLEGKLDEPKNSGRRVAVALEVEIAMKESSRQGSKRVDLPLADRSLGLEYAWFR